MKRLALLALCLTTVGGCATNSGPPPSMVVQAKPAHIRDVLVALMTTASIKTNQTMRVVSATPYSVVFDGPQGSGSWLTPSGYAEVEVTMAPESTGTLVVAHTYNVAPEGNIATGTAMRAETTGSNRQKFLLPLLKAVKKCAEDNPPKTCPGE